MDDTTLHLLRYITTPDSKQLESARHKASFKSSHLALVLRRDLIPCLTPLVQDFKVPKGVGTGSVPNSLSREDLRTASVPNFGLQSRPSVAPQQPAAEINWQDAPLPQVTV